MTRKRFGTREWELNVYNHFLEHARAEGEILEAYERLVNDESMSPAFRYLAGIICEDEVRHHEVFAQLAATMGGMVDDDPDAAPVPSLRGLRADRHRIDRLTHRLLVLERQDDAELADLARQVRGFDHTTMWSLLIELMRDDTRKHIKILEFIRDRAADQPD